VENSITVLFKHLIPHTTGMTFSFWVTASDKVDLAVFMIELGYNGGSPGHWWGDIFNKTVTLQAGVRTYLEFTFDPNDTNLITTNVPRLEFKFFSDSEGSWYKNIFHIEDISFTPAT